MISEISVRMIPWTDAKVFPKRGAGDGCMEFSSHIPLSTFEYMYTTSGTYNTNFVLYAPG